ncbi:MAG: cbb3-type cytochrome c oxidase subunit I [Chitinophagaceae bacterium]|nr:cbb3-type cytochrome c oxidase subunit I [Chitinophagaceae bacterium]
MAPFSNKQDIILRNFLITVLCLLFLGMFFGLTGALQYLSPGFLKNYLSFERVRPLHVSSVVFWIIFGAACCVLTYVKEYVAGNLFSWKILKLAYVIFLFSTIIILSSYVYGIFGGREYWEFNPVLAIPVTIVWVLLLINFVKSIKTFKKQPVYIWMWLTGFCFFLFTYLESNLWLIPFFRNNVVYELTVQWKSYGAMVGSWNMLIYGCGIYLMDKISGTKEYGFSKTAFAIYFLGLFNLMFNWGHHIYTLPTHSLIKNIAYVVSMTELILFVRIIYLWKSSLSTALKHFHYLPYKFLMAADIWIFLTLALAIPMSIPAVNIYTHGTHVTVGHTMGATIGINTMLLFAFIFDIIWKEKIIAPEKIKNFNLVYWIANGALLSFWLALVIAGFLKGHWQMHPASVPFSAMMSSLKPFFIIFFIAGSLLFLSLSVFIFVAVSALVKMKPQATPQAAT